MTLLFKYWTSQGTSVSLRTPLVSMAGGFLVSCCLAVLAESPVSAQNASTAVADDESAADTRSPDTQPNEDTQTSGEESSDATYPSAVDLLPANTAGLVRFPSLPEFCEVAGQTNLGRLLNEPLVKEFREAQRELAKGWLDSLDKKIGLKLEDIYEIASGEVVAAWLPYPKEKRRPYAVCVIADIHGRQDQADKVLEQIDQDMKAREATRKEIQHRGETIRVYLPKTKVGQLKIEQIAIWSNEERIIAADRDSLVKELIDALAGERSGPTIGEAENFLKIRERSEASILADAKKLDEGDSKGLPIGVQWYAEPFAMGQILKEALDIDRGKDVEILPLLENQGFDAIEAAGGAVAIGVGPYDWLHRGVVLAPPTGEGESRYRLAARMLDFPNQDRHNIPDWIPPQLATYVHVSWKMGDAFMALETLVDEALGQPFFREVFDDLKRDDPDGKLDILGRVVPNLGTNLMLMTDNTLPETPTSERLLAAVELVDGTTVKETVDEIMSNEDGVVELDEVPGLRVWQYDESSIEEGFDDFLDFEDEAEEEENAETDRLLPRWAVTVFPKSQATGNAYFLFSSHTELLVETVQRMQQAQRTQQAQNPGFGAQNDVKQALDAMESLGPQRVALTRIARLSLARRIKYELLRQGELKNSDSILASLVKRLFNEDDLAEDDPIHAAKLPRFSQIEKYFGTGANFLVTTEDGWALNGFILKD